MKTLAQALLNVSNRLPVEDKKVADRVGRAYDIVRMLGSGYNIVKKGEGSNEYRVYKESTSLLEDNSVYYYIVDGMCSCPDAPSARGNLCKHRVAVMLIEEMDRA